MFQAQSEEGGAQSKSLGRKKHVKGEVHPKMITSYLVMFGALSRMVRVRGAYDKPLWIYKRLNNCAAPAPASDDVLVIEEEVFLCAGHAKEATTKTSSSSTGSGPRGHKWYGSPANAGRNCGQINGARLRLPYGCSNNPTHQHTVINSSFSSSL